MISSSSEDEFDVIEFDEIISIHKEIDDREKESSD